MGCWKRASRRVPHKFANTALKVKYKTSPRTRFPTIPFLALVPYASASTKRLIQTVVSTGSRVGRKLRSPQGAWHKSHEERQGGGPPRPLGACAVIGQRRPAGLPRVLRTSNSLLARFPFSFPPSLHVLQSISVDIRKKHCSTEAVEQWHTSGPLANPQEQAGNKGMLPACPETDGLNAYFENCRPGSFGLPFFRRNRSSFEPVIETRPSIFWPSLRVRTRSFPSGYRCRRTTGFARCCPPST